MANVRLDELLGAQDPGDTPAGQAEALGEAVDDEDVVLVDVHDIFLPSLSVIAFVIRSSFTQTYGSADGSAIAVTRVVVTRVELVTDEGGTVTAEVLDLGQLWVGDDSAGGIAWVRRKDHTSASGNLLADLFGVDVVPIVFAQGNRNGGELRAPRTQPTPLFGPE